MNIAEAEKATILRCEVGSKAYGTSVDDNSDRDEMGVMLEPLRTILTKDLPKPFVWRDATQREGDVNAKSKAGDLDLKLYGLKHFVRLALGGNPDVLMLLYTKPITADARGMRLQELRDKFVSQEAIPKFKGYLNNQRLRLLGLKGQKDVHRPDLVEKYGFDTKYAMQMIRLGYQGLELISKGTISIPMHPVQAQVCKDIRLGKFSEPMCIEMSQDLESMIDGAILATPLPPKPDTECVWEFAEGVYLEYWKCRDFDKWRRYDSQIREQREGDSDGL